ncbi:hypothetical protein ABZ951_20890 [Streptomyces sp. NPDC046215]|uniref:hypothetical protein n=1 Tax=Streptomyces TaxID=1883 RepID=UPI0031DFFDD9
MARAQGGVVLAAQVPGALGWSRRKAHRHFTQGGWTLLWKGVWLEPGRAVDGQALVWAHQLAGPQLVVSHWAAAAVHGVEVLSERVDFTCPRKGRADVKGGGVLHRLPLGDREVTTVGGLRVTAVPRTMADLLRAGPREEALVAVESAVSWRPVRGVGARGRRGPLTTLAEVAHALRAAPPMRGAKTAAAWLAMADARSGSPAETVARLRMNDAGLYPECQVLMVTPTGRRAYPDFYFRAQGLVVEVEGYAWHGTRAQHQRDTARFNDLSACPEVRRILRFTAADVFHRPGLVVRDVGDALALLDAGRGGVGGRCN